MSNRTYNRAAAEKADPSVSLLEEIGDQDIAADGGTLTIVSYTIASWTLGNDGYVCTATVECINNCRN